MLQVLQVLQVFICSLIQQYNVPWYWSFRDTICSDKIWYPYTYCGSLQVYKSICRRLQVYAGVWRCCRYLNIYRKDIDAVFKYCNKTGQFWKLINDTCNTCAGVKEYWRNLCSILTFSSKEALHLWGKVCNTCRHLRTPAYTCVHLQTPADACSHPQYL